MSEDNKKTIMHPTRLCTPIFNIFKWVEFTYKCTKFYHNEDESEII